MADFKEDINKMMQEESKTFRKIIGFDTNQMLDHLEDIADFYTAIENKQVLKIVYNAAYLKKKTITIAPHFIKEYNYRWFLLGKGMDEDGKVRESYVCAVDRIESYELVDDSYSECNIDYTKYFNDIIGVTHYEDKQGKPYAKRLIEIETRTYNVHKRLISKKLHSSQTTVKEFGPGQKDYGVISINVIPNNELMGLLLSFGPDIRIIPSKDSASFLRMFREKVNQLAEVYNINGI
jgi:hypothetical protein